MKSADLITKGKLSAFSPPFIEKFYRNLQWIWLYFDKTCSIRQNNAMKHSTKIRHEQQIHTQLMLIWINVSSSCLPKHLKLLFNSNPNTCWANCLNTSERAANFYFTSVSYENSNQKYTLRQNILLHFDFENKIRFIELLFLFSLFYSSSKSWTNSLCIWQIFRSTLWRIGAICLLMGTISRVLSVLSFSHALWDFICQNEKRSWKK